MPRRSWTTSKGRPKSAACCADSELVSQTSFQRGRCGQPCHFRRKRPSQPGLRLFLNLARKQRRHDTTERSFNFCRSTLTPGRGDVMDDVQEYKSATRFAATNDVRHEYFRPAVFPCSYFAVLFGDFTILSQVQGEIGSSRLIVNAPTVRCFMHRHDQFPR